MKTHVANDKPRLNPLSPNGMFGVPDLESMAANTCRQSLTLIT